MLAHVAGHDKSRVQLLALTTYPPPQPLTHPGSQIMSALVDVWEVLVSWPGRPQLRTGQSFVWRA
jgi:hypothetical protein